MSKSKCVEWCNYFFALFPNLFCFTVRKFGDETINVGVVDISFESVDYLPMLESNDCGNGGNFEFFGYISRHINVDLSEVDLS